MPRWWLRGLGFSLALAGMLAWAFAIALQPALQDAGIAANSDGRELPYAINSDTDLMLLLDAHDLRLAALLVVFTGVAMIVTGVPRAAARPGLVLLAIGIALAAANLGWGFTGVRGVLWAVAMAVSTATLALLAAVGVARRYPPLEPVQPARALLVTPALIAAGTSVALSLQTAPHPALRDVVPEQYLYLLIVVQVLLVVVAVAAVSATGRHQPARAGAGIMIVVAAVASVVAGLGAAQSDVSTGTRLFAGLLGAAVLLLAWTGEPFVLRNMPAQAAGLAVVVGTPLFFIVLLMMIGLPIGVLTLTLSLAEIGADGFPMLGSGLVFGALLVVVDVFARLPAPAVVRRAQDVGDA